MHTQKQTHTHTDTHTHTLTQTQTHTHSRTYRYILTYICGFYSIFPVSEPHTRCTAGFQSVPSLPDVDNRLEHVINHKHSHHSLYDI